MRSQEASFLFALSLTLRRNDSHLVVYPSQRRQNFPQLSQEKGIPLSAAKFRKALKIINLARRHYPFYSVCVCMKSATSLSSASAETVSICCINKQRIAWHFVELEERLWIAVCVWHYWCAVTYSVHCCNKITQELLSNCADPLLSAHDVEKFALLTTTWKGHRYSRGILGSDVHPGFCWKHMLWLLQY